MALDLKLAMRKALDRELRENFQKAKQAAGDAPRIVSNCTCCEEFGLPCPYEDEPEAAA